MAPQQTMPAFDAPLVRDVGSLFVDAAMIIRNHGLLFPRGRNNHYRPGLVRSLYRLSEHDFSSWGRNSWRAKTNERQLVVTRRLIAIFSGDDDRFVRNADRYKAEAVKQRWEKHELLESVLRRLHQYAEQLESERADTGVGSAHRASVARVVPADLSPPPRIWGGSRPDCVSALSGLATDSFCIVIQGMANCGKSSLAKEIVENGPLSPDRMVLWCHLRSETLMTDVLARLSLLDVPFVASGDDFHGQLISWLEHENIVLVLDGLGDRNVFSFAPLLELAIRLPGPSRIVVTSSVVIKGDTSYDVPPLSGPELFAMLAAAKIDVDRGEAEASARLMKIWPYTVSKAIALSGKGDVGSLREASQARSAELVRTLSPEDRWLVEVLGELEGDWDLALLGEILAAQGRDDEASDVAERLRSGFVLRQVSGSHWRLELDRGTESKLSTSRPEVAAVLGRLAAHYESLARPDTQLPIQFSPANCRHVYAAVRLLQRANRDVSRRRYLMRGIWRPMESAGSQRLLTRLYEGEAEVGWEPPEWPSFKYARALYATGELRKALLEFERIFDWLVGGKAEDIEDRDGLYMSVLRSTAELLIDVGQPELALVVLDGALESAEIAKIPAKVGIQTVSVLTWALLKFGKIDESVAINDEILDRRLHSLSGDFAKAISQVRVGVARLGQGRFDEGASLLEEANRYFEVNDRRAFAWSAQHLAMAYHGAGRYDDAQDSLRRAIEANASDGLVGSDLSATYRTFLAQTEYEELHRTIETELERISKYERERADLGREIQDSKFIEHVLLDLGREPSSTYDYDLERYELFSTGRPHAIGSKFSQNLIRSVSKENLEKAVEGIFAQNEPAFIFRIHIFNRIIINLCKERPLLRKKYILPHLKVIEQQMDGVQFIYARYFEAIEDVETSLALLALARNKTTFNYFNIRANCEGRVDFSEGMSLNEEALRAARGRQQRAQIQHNQASLIFSHSVKSRFEEAMELCEASVANATKARFTWPADLLLKLRLSVAELEAVGDVIATHKQRFRVKSRHLISVCKELKWSALRRAALAAIDRLD